jgi:hypothetical protein
MPTLRRALTTGAIAATTAALILGSAGPTGAAVPPDWPASGRYPVGCAAMSPGGGPGAYTYVFTDTAAPVITSVGWSSGRFTVLTPAGRSVRLEVRARQTCSGVFAAAVRFRENGGELSTPVLLPPVTTDAFSALMASEYERATPDDAGSWVFPVATTARRYDAFALDDDFRLTDSIVSSTSYSVQGTWSTQPQYLLRATTLTSAVSKAKVAKGAKVTVSGVLRYATDLGYVAYGGRSVVLETKVGAGAWKARTTLTASVSGAVSSKLKITKRTQVRLVSAAVLSGLYTAAVTSPTRTVKVA